MSEQPASTSAPRATRDHLMRRSITREGAVDPVHTRSRAVASALSHRCNATCRPVTYPHAYRRLPRPRADVKNALDASLAAACGEVVQVLADDLLGEIR